VRAAREVLRVRTNVRFVLCGPATPAHREALRSLVQSFGAEAAVAVREAVRHTGVPELLAAADVCVVATEDDERARVFGPFAVKVAEAMATARAVAVSRVPAHAELVNEGDEGAFFPAGDADALAAVLLRLLGAADERAALGQRAHARARETVSHAVYREKLLALYGDLLGEGAAAHRFASEKTLPRGTARP